MYRMGTGDCFALKFLNGDEVCFKMLIDAGVWSGKAEDITKYIENLKIYLGDKIDVLVVTHEHKDHVYAFQVCKELFTEHFEVGELWLGWTENDRIKKVKDWKEKYGEHKMALGLAARHLQDALESDDYKKQFAETRFGVQAMEARKNYVEVVTQFADLHLSTDDMNMYKGGLDGMEVVKNDIDAAAVKYFKPGDIISDIEEAPGIKIYVLGPPTLYEDVDKETGGIGESYKHNNELEKSGAFGAAVINMNGDDIETHRLLPFDEYYSMDQPAGVQQEYEKSDWRKIDYDWLYSAGSFALRMNGLTNNLSLALAIEFEDSGRVMLFPGDAEYGSWASWHNIDWGQKGRDGVTPFVEDLLNRTVFYKVAHHLSHNGTAQRLGLEMMKHKDLVAMATLDYNIICKGWKSTMPNRAIVKELLERTKGRLLILREDDIYYDFHNEVSITEKIEEAQEAMTKKEREAFEKATQKEELYIQFTVKA
jgi:hypothetical protein